MHTISTEFESRVKDFYLDLRNYIAVSFDGADHDDTMLDWNSVGATLGYSDESHTIYIRLWEHSEGYLNLPDNVMIVETVSFTLTSEEPRSADNAERLRTEMNTFSRWLIATAKLYGIDYVADPNMAPIPGANLPDVPIACLRLKKPRPSNLV